MKKRLLVSLSLLALSTVFLLEVRAEDHLLSILKSELQRETDQFKASGESTPYFISYRVDDVYESSTRASFGSLYQKMTENHAKTLTPMVRIGSYQMDNYREIAQKGMTSSSGAWRIPLDDEKGDATRMVIWKATRGAWDNGIQNLANVKSKAQVRVEKEDKSDDYSKEVPVKYIEKELTSAQLRVDSALWEERIKEYSAIFKEYPEIRSGEASFSFQRYRKYYVSSEGTEIAQNLSYCRVMVSAQVVADDGMYLPLYLSYFAYEPKGITAHETILKETREMAETLVKLRTSPIVDSYTGPAILSPEASGVFFHEIFGHRIEGQRLKSESDGQTFKKKVGEPVLPSDISVIMDPTIKSFGGTDLNGSYLYDDEGVKSKKVDVVKDGILKEFLMSRTPIEGFPASNGHGRAAPGRDPVTRQSNLIITTTAPKTSEELRSILKEEAKKQGKEYGYYFTKVSGGFTQTGRYNPNAFNVTPLEVYRVYVNGQPDELVRGVTLIGTPLSMFSQISKVGDKAGIFTGICGAESGSIPVTGISPEVFVNVIETQKASKSDEKLPILPRPQSNQSKETK
ncbi:MAG: metallopeptidase TldD-related protein [Bacteroidales bacterium]|nr:metallopeptidase TldD-related protein [Bacteroidales bacterium]